MPTLTEECPTATHFLFVAASGEGGASRDQSGFCWWILTPDTERLSGGNNTLTAPVQDWHPAALLHATLEAAPNVPPGGHLHVVSTYKDHTDLLNEKPSARRERDYRKSDGKPLANEKKWRELDDTFTELQLTVNAGPPKSASAKRVFRALSAFASDLKNNINNPGEWSEWSKSTSAVITDPSRERG
jgi:hypothetical protein